MKDYEAIKKEVLEECEEDHVGVWNVVRDVKQYMPKADETTVKETTISVLEELLQERKIAAGYPTKEGTFVVWEVPTTNVIDHIKAVWKCLGREPKMGEAVWFTTVAKAAA